MASRSADQEAPAVTGGERGGGERGGGERGERGFARGRRRRRARRGEGEGGGGRGGGGRRGKEDEGVWTPVTKLGRLVKDGRIKYLEEIYLHSLPVKESQIIDYFLKDVLKDEVMKIMPVQKQTRAGQRTKFKAFIVVGDHDGHIGLGSKCAKEVATSIRGAMMDAKMNLVPVRRGFWGNKIGKPHTVPGKVNGRCGSIRIRLIPAPRGAGIVAAPTPKKILSMAGIEDVYTQTRGRTSTLGNFAKATVAALTVTYRYLTPDLWPQYELTKTPFQEHSDFLAQTDTFETKKGGKDDE